MCFGDAEAARLRSGVRLSTSSEHLLNLSAIILPERKLLIVGVRGLCSYTELSHSSDDLRGRQILEPSLGVIGLGSGVNGSTSSEHLRELPVYELARDEVMYLGSGVRSATSSDPLREWLIVSVENFRRLDVGRDCTMCRGSGVNRSTSESLLLCPIASEHCLPNTACRPASEPVRGGADANVDCRTRGEHAAGVDRVNASANLSVNSLLLSSMGECLGVCLGECRGECLGECLGECKDDRLLGTVVSSLVSTGKGSKR